MDETLKECLAPVSAALAEFELSFRETIADGSGLRGAIADHLTASRGKRLRPALVLLAHRSQAPNGPPTVLAAVAIELIHTATLLHDDVIDVSHHRRGFPSVNARWNNLTAVLAGDHLFARAFGLLVGLKNHRLLEAVSAATQRVAVGELQQLQHNRNFALDESGYLGIIADKTASLFGASCQAGLLEARADSPHAEVYRQFGETLGMSFQIVDDVLDYVGDPQKTGKMPGNDLKEGKITLPLIQALKCAGPAARQYALSVMQDYTPEDFGRVCDFIREHRGFEYAQSKADQLKDQAHTLLRGFPDSPYRRALGLIVDYSVSRSA